jgi:hypothetical protein
MLATTGVGNTVFLWDVSNGVLLKQLQGHAAPISAVAFSPSSRLLASGSGGIPYYQGKAVDNTIYLWDVATGKRFLLLGDQGAQVSAVAFAQGEMLLVSGSLDGIIRLWEVASGKEVLSFCEPRTKVVSVSASPDGRSIASGTADGGVVTWELTPSGWLPPPSSKKWVPQELERLWADLASSDPRIAYRSVCTMSVAAAPSFFASRIQPVPLEKSQRIAQLIQSLDNDDFGKRVAASKELLRLGAQVIPLLNKALSETQSEEVRGRVKLLLSQLGKWTIDDPDALRRTRAIWVLQCIGTPDARAVLAELAKGAPGARQTQTAASALQWLRTRPHN